MNSTFARAGIAGLALGLTASLGLVTGSIAAEDLPHSSLMAADGSGVPAGFTSEQWLAASGEAEVVAREDDQDVIEFQASGLVPEGLYTFWWVSERLIGMGMGPGGGLPDNEFTADAEGNATATIRVPSDNDYQMMVVAYHADDQTHGESPGEMGTVTFEHLMGPWPGPAGEMTQLGNRPNFPAVQLQARACLPCARPRLQARPGHTRLLEDWSASAA